MRSLDESFTAHYSPVPAYRFEITCGFTNRKNLSGDEHAVKQQIGSGIQFTRHSRFRIRGELSLIHYRYDFPVNTSIAYRMLEGLKPGRNGTWRLLVQKEIYKNLEMNIHYSGRLSENQSAIHTGQVELRAIF
jgi:hypothetical protein